MMDMSSVVDASLALIGAVAVLTFGLYALVAQSTSVPAARGHEPESQELRRAA